MLRYREEDDNNRDPYSMAVVKGIGSIWCQYEWSNCKPHSTGCNPFLQGLTLQQLQLLEQGGILIMCKED